MPNRREVCRIMTGAVAAALLPSLEAKGAAVRNTHTYAKASFMDNSSLLAQQQAFLDLRFGMFLHFNMATFQDREWGNPNDAPDVFAPTDLDTDQWATAAKSAGMRYGCLTTKHHDGFCIWPTNTPVASVKDTKHKLDIVRAYADSFRKQGLQVALYYSILDLRNDIRHFNITKDKIRLIKDQLTELLTHYGEINMLIFDGWDAPWSRISYEEVPFHEIYELVKRLQPNCLISELNASQYPSSALYYSDIKAFEQNAGQHLPDDSEIPAQSCVTLTDGWFWKQSDKDAELKPVKQIVEEWLIPQNNLHCNLILNTAPNREGKLAPNVVARLAEIGKAWKHSGPAPKIDPAPVITMPNLATGQRIHASSSPDTVGPDLANDGRFGSSWSPEETSGWLEITLDHSRSFNTFIFVEPRSASGGYGRESRIASYRIQRWDKNAWTDIATGTTPSRVQIHQFPRIAAERVRLVIEGKKDSPAIAEVGIYDEPRVVSTANG